MTLQAYVREVPRWERRWNTLASILESYKQVYGSLPPDKRPPDWYTRLEK